VENVHDSKTKELKILKMKSKYVDLITFRTKVKEYCIENNGRPAFYYREESPQLEKKVGLIK
jgi:hypothetical protein